MSQRSVVVADRAADFDHELREILAVKGTRSFTYAEADQWLTECDAMLDALRGADTPMARRDLQLVANVGYKAALARLDWLLDRGEVATVGAGELADGRVTWYVAVDDSAEWTIGDPSFSSLAKAHIEW